MTIAQLPPFDLRVIYDWMRPEAVMAARLTGATPQCWLDAAKGPIAASSLLTTTRSSSIVLPDSAGVFQTLGNDTLPRTDRGLIPNGQLTNIVARSNPTVAQLSTATNVSDAAGFSGLPNSIEFAGGVTAAAYQGGITADSVPYAASFLVQMLDGDPPVFSGVGTSSSSTFSIVVRGVGVPSSNISARQIGTDIWIVSAVGITGTTGGNFGIIQYSGNQNRAFRVCGYQIFASTFVPDALVPGTLDAGGPTLMASDIRAVQGTRPSNSQPEPLPGWEAAGLDDGLTVLLDFENRMRQAEARQVVSLNDASNAVVAILDTTSVGTSFRLTAGGGSDTFPGGQTGGRSRVACRVMPDGAFALAQKGQGTVTTGTKASPVNLASATRLTIGNRPQLDTPWNDWIYGLQICKPLSDAALLDWVNAA